MKSTLKILSVGAAFAIGFCTMSTAEASTQVYASATGWIQASGGANNSGFNGVVTNNYAGWEYQQYNDWFAFNLPSAPITNASISIWNDSRSSTLDAAAVYSLYKATGFTFSGLTNGSSSLGSVSLGVADTGVGQYITFGLNSTAIPLLNASLGGQFVMGGSISTSYPNPNSTTDQIDAWGYTGGSPVAYLTLNSVPEPASWALMVVGLGGMGASLRSRRRTAAAAAA